MEAAGNQDISQTVDEQGYLLCQHHDQLAQLEKAIEKALRSVHLLEHARAVLWSTSGGYSTTSRPSEPAQQPIRNPLRSAMPICPSLINMMAHHLNAVAFYFSTPSTLCTRYFSADWEVLEWATANWERS